MNDVLERAELARPIAIGGQAMHTPRSPAEHRLAGRWPESRCEALPRASSSFPSGRATTKRNQRQPPMRCSCSRLLAGWSLRIGRLAVLERALRGAGLPTQARVARPREPMLAHPAGSPPILRRNGIRARDGPKSPEPVTARAFHFGEDKRKCLAAKPDYLLVRGVHRDLGRGRKVGSVRTPRVG